MIDSVLTGSNYICQIEFWIHFLSTLKIFSVGILISYVCSFFIIFLGFKSNIFHKIIHSIVLFLQPIPRIVLFPLLLLIFGINDFSRIILIAIGLMFSNYLILDSAARELKFSPYMRILKIYKVRSLKIFYFYYIKGIMAPFLSTYKNSVGYGLTLAIVAESSFSNTGLGYLIWRHWERYEMSELYIVILMISFLAIVLNFVPKAVRILLQYVKS